MSVNRTLELVDSIELPRKEVGVDGLLLVGIIVWLVCTMTGQKLTSLLKR